MAPLEVITNDTLSTMIRFQTSAVYELIISLQTLMYPRRRTAWANQIRAELPSDFMEELAVVYEPFYNGVELIELPVDYPNHHDVPGFLEYVRNMDAVRFVFYILGRRLPISQIEEIGFNTPALLEAIQVHFEHYCSEKRMPPWANILQDVEGFQQRLVNLWERYWHDVFEHIVGDLQPYWETGLNENERILTHQGSDTLFDHLLGRKLKMPKPLPPNQPITEIVFVPLYLIPHRAFFFYGYGNITILFDCEHTPARAQQVEEGKEFALSVVRALGDATRIRILRLIAHHEGQINGKQIAEKMQLSASAVSRHLSQLRDSGVITEEPLDHRNITYRLQREAITAIPDKLLDYLYT